jgi:hypothetical protein
VTHEVATTQPLGSAAAYQLNGAWPEVALGAKRRYSLTGRETGIALDIRTPGAIVLNNSFE